MGATSIMKMRTDLSERLILEIPNEIDEAEPLDSQKSVKPRGNLLLQMDLENSLHLSVESRQQRHRKQLQLAQSSLVRRDKRLAPVHTSLQRVKRSKMARGLFAKEADSGCNGLSNCSHVNPEKPRAEKIRGDRSCASPSGKTRDRVRGNLAGQAREVTPGRENILPKRAPITLSKKNGTACDELPQSCGKGIDLTAKRLAAATPKSLDSSHLMVRWTSRGSRILVAAAAAVQR